MISIGGGGIVVILLVTVLSYHGSTESVQPGNRRNSTIRCSVSPVNLLALQDC